VRGRQGRRQGQGLLSQRRNRIFWTAARLDWLELRGLPLTKRSGIWWLSRLFVWLRSADCEILYYSLSLISNATSYLFIHDQSSSYCHGVCWRKNWCLWPRAWGFPRHFYRNLKSQPGASHVTFTGRWYLSLKVLSVLSHGAPVKKSETILMRSAMAVSSLTAVPTRTDEWYQVAARYCRYSEPGRPHVSFIEL